MARTAMAAQRGSMINYKMVGYQVLLGDVIQQDVDCTPLLDPVQLAPYLLSMTLKMLDLIVIFERSVGQSYGRLLKLQLGYPGVRYLEL